MSSNFLCTFILVSFGLGLVPLALGKTCTKQQRVTYMSWKMDPYTQRLRPQPQAFERINIVCCPGYREAFRSGTIPVCVPNCQLNCVGGFCDGKNQCACHEGYRRIGIGHCEPEEGTTTTTTTTAMPTTTTTTTTRPTTTTTMPTTMTTTTTTRRPTTTTRRPTTTTEPTTTTTTMPTTTTTKPTTTTTTMPTTTTTKPTTTTTTMPTTTTTKPTTTTTTMPTTTTTKPTTTTTTMPTTTTTMPTTTTTTTVRAVPATSTTTTRTVPTAPTTTTPHPTTTTSTTTPATSTTTTTSPTSSIPKEKFASRFLYKTQQLQIKEATPHATEPQSPLVKFPPLDPRFGTLPATNHLTGLECEGSVNCACPSGYTHDIQASKCRPLCNGKIYGCIGGTCIGANQCRCDEDKYLDSGELFHCRALHFHWKWTLLLLLVPAGLIVISSYVAIRRWRTAKANRLNAQSERFSEVRLHSTNSHSIDEKHQWARRGCDSDDDDDQVFLGASSSRPLFREKVQIV